MSITKEEFKELKAKAKSGDLDAMCSFAECHREYGGYKNDEEKRKKIYEKAAKLGSTDAQYWLAMYNRGGKPKKCAALCHEAAEQGHAGAMFELARRYSSGYSSAGVKKDEAEALKWYIKAAQNGHIEAQIELAKIYDRGNNVAQEDKEKSFHWYSLAAEQGNETALCECAFKYYRGEGVKQDYKKAYQICMQLVNSGKTENVISSAMWYLGWMYEGGHGVKRDLKTAYTWYRKSELKGNTYAKQYADKLYNKVTDSSVNLDNVMQRMNNTQSRNSSPKDDFILVPHIDVSDM